MSKLEYWIMAMIFCIISLAINIPLTWRCKENTLRKFMGHNVTIGNETVTIVDYDFFTDTLTLSNGMKIKVDLLPLITNQRRP